MNKYQKETEAILLNHEKEIFEELKQTYTRALADTKNMIKELYSNIEVLENNEADDSIIQSKIYRLNYQKVIEEQLSNTLAAMNSKNVSNIQTFLTKIYEDSYLSIDYNLNKQGLAMITRINPQLMIDIINKPTGSMKFSERLYENTKELKKIVKSEISRGIATGRTYSEISKSIAARTEADFNKSYRIARTEGGRVSSEAKLEAMRDAKNKGADIVKQWDATLDFKTRQEHAMLDQQIKELDEPFEVGGMEAMAPHSFGIAAMDINCRCALLSIPRWSIQDENERYAKEQFKENNELIVAKNYNEWKEKYYGIINETNENYIRFNSIEEAEKYAKDTFKIMKCVYKGFDLETANQLNNAINYYNNSYPELVNELKFLGGSQERNKMIKQEAYNYYYNILEANNPNLSEDKLKFYAKKYANRIVHRVNGNTFAISHYSDNVIAKKFNGISINIKYAADYKYFLECVESNVKTKFHPIGTDNIKSIIDHELGHQLDNLLKIKEEKNIQDLYNNSSKADITNNLSRYSWDNDNRNKYSEMIAEGWAEYLNNPDPRPMAKEIGTTIERKYQEWIKKNSLKK